MAYYIKKSGALIPGDVYWTGGSNWSDDISKKKIFMLIQVQQPLF